MPRAALSVDEIEAFREELCRVAEARFAEAGYAGVTLRGLATELGVSAMTPYRYFRDKDEIFTAVRTAAFARFADSQEAVRAAGSHPLEGLRAGARAYIAFARREPHAYRIMFEMNRPGDRGHSELAREAARAFATLLRGVRAACAAGALAGDPETIAHLFWAGLHGIVSLELAGTLPRELHLEDLTEPMIETLLRGVAPSASRVKEMA